MGFRQNSVGIPSGSWRKSNKILLGIGEDSVRVQVGFASGSHKGTIMNPPRNHRAFLKNMSTTCQETMHCAGFHKDSCQNSQGMWKACKDTVRGCQDIARHLPGKCPKVEHPFKSVRIPPGAVQQSYSDVPR